MIGLFFEDINYGLDGGLNAQLIQNRNFEMLYASSEDFGKFETKFDGLYAWRSEGNAMISISDENPVSSANPHYLVCDVLMSGSGFSNNAYDGFSVRKGASYEVSFYAKADTERKVTLQAAKGDAVAFGVDFTINSSEFKEYKATVKAEADVSFAQVKVIIADTGRICFDFFSLKPSDAVMGLFRKDLANMLKDIKPDFLRFPGGCVVEGSTLESRYDWKRTVGEVKDRRFNWSRWAVHTSWLEPEVGPYHYYGQSYEIGFYEFFLLCEYLNCKPAPVVSVGLACQFQTLEKVDVNDPEFMNYVQDAIDLIEFANGPEDSKWGSLRAKMGHPEPFGMDMIGIGNEQWEDENSQFFERYRIFEKKIHEVYPDMKLIGTAGPDVYSDRYSASWDFIRKEHEKNKNFVYAVDEHYYVSPDWLIENNAFYDNYPRDIKVFAGEYACHIEGANGRFNRPDANSHLAALAEAAFMTGLERNQDVVVMASYAPLLSKLGYSQWSPNLIWFNGESAYATPSYYVQKLFSTHEGEYVKKFVHPTDKELFASAVIDGEGKLIIKAVNVSDTEKSLDISSVYEDDLNATVKAYELCAVKDAYNTVEEPYKVAPTQMITVVSDALSIKPNSFKVIVFP